MRTKKVSTALKGLAVSSLLASPLSSAFATNLSIGADYLLRHVATEERDPNIKNLEYYDSRLQAYLTTDLSKDVEASVRVQSITPWGLEGSTNPLTTRYPSSNGNLWVQNAYLRLPHIWQDRIVLTIGRQPIVWGDGAILSDDDLGFNAVRAQVKSPVRWVPFDLDVFTAKISEGLRGPGDTNLNGAVIGWDRELFRWEAVGLWENSDAQQQYAAGADVSTTTAVNKITRTIYGLRAKATLKDAFLRGEYYMQSGKVTPTDPAEEKTKLGGSGFIVGLGGKSTNKWVGRFGAILEYADADGDDPKTPDKDEAFRPTFASRWNGLERKGFGRYYAASWSDAYSPADPFGLPSASNDGLPEGASGIQTIHGGIDMTPWAEWTFVVDFYQYKANKVALGNKDLGTELDYEIQYRYSGLVTFKGYWATFNPGEAYSTTTTPGVTAAKRKGKTIGLEAQIKF